MRQIRHHPDDAARDHNPPQDFHGLHLPGLLLALKETLLRGDSRRHRRPNQDSEMWCYRFTTPKSGQMTDFFEL